MVTKSRKEGRVSSINFPTLYQPLWPYFLIKETSPATVVPNCDHHHQRFNGQLRPSSSMVGRCKSRTPSHFFKIILPSTIKHMKLVSNLPCYTIFQWLNVWFWICSLAQLLVHACEFLFQFLFLILFCLI